MVVYNGLNLETFDKAIMKVDYSRIQNIINEISGKPTIISMGSQLVPRKGHAYLLKAIKYVKHKYPNIRCVITGTGPLLERLKKMASSLQIEHNVIFTGYLRYEDMLQILKLADVAAITSLSETFCHAIIEPLAAKKPIVTTPVGVALELIPYGIGFIVPKKDARSLSKAIIQLISNPKQANEMGVRGRLLVERFFSLEAIIRNLQKAYEFASRRIFRNAGYD
jgi:glycosyltransferase involved in cell wall biosynthesis